MIKATARTPGGPLLFLGLTGENMTRLLADEPIIVNAATLGLPKVTVLLVGGRTNEDIADAVRRHVRVMATHPAPASDDDDRLTGPELLLYNHYRQLGCPSVVDPVDTEDCAGMAVETIRFLRANGLMLHE